jgi:glycosyltransferase involved in cell wall biosynthesis
VSVCFVIDRLSRAGTETQLLALIRHLDREKIRPSLCLLNGDRREDNLCLEDCPVLDLGLKKLMRPAAVTAAAKLVGFWRRHNADAVVTYFLDSTYFAAPLARLCGIRRVVRVRNNAGYWLTPLHRRLGRIVGRLCSLTLTNSDQGRRSLIASEGLPADRIRVIENGVDLERFPVTAPPGAGGRVVRIGALANLRTVKNVDGLVRVAEVICRAHPHVRFAVAGEGEQRLALECQVRATGLKDRFALVGTVSDVPGFLAGLDIAVLCSHSESMSNALLEYMATGRAIVATDVGSNARMVRPGREGLIVPQGDDAALTGAIGRLIADPALAQSLAAAARDRAAAEFSRGAMVRRFEEFFASLVKR